MLFKPIRLAKTKKSDDIKYCQDVELRELLDTVDGNRNCTIMAKNNLAISVKTKAHITCSPTILGPGS